MQGHVVGWNSSLHVNDGLSHYYYAAVVSSYYSYFYYCELLKDVPQVQ